MAVIFSTTLSLPSTLTRIDYYAFMDVPLLTNVYCYADPTTLSWQNNDSQFLPEKATQFHVTDADAWTAQFPNANVTFVGDLPTGIMHNEECIMHNSPSSVYDLQGRKVTTPLSSRRGAGGEARIYIINGKKVILK